MRQYVHLFGGLKVRKSPKVQNSMKQLVVYNPFYGPQGAGPIVKPKVWRALQEEIRRLKERPIYAE